MIVSDKNGIYRIEFTKIKNSNKFRQAAICFQKNGYYTTSPRGTTAHKEYWEEERKRCVYGYTADDGDHITGYHYFYLNYCPILLQKTIGYVFKGSRKIPKKRRVRDFPRFYDHDKNYFDAIEAAEEEGKHIAVIKARGKGYSFKGGSMLCRNFFLIPSSKSYAIASEKEFLTKDGLLSKAWEFMDFIDSSTAWSKKKQKINTTMHKRASVIVTKDGVETEAGYKSEIMGVTLKNDESRARGKRAKLILWEEGGKFPNLKQAWQIARPSVEDEDGVAYGLMCLWGTGGTDQANYEGLSNIFNEPEAYNCISFENQWEDAAGKHCGFFVPHYMNMEGMDEEGLPFMDSDGNTNVDIAVKYCKSERDKVIENASDKRAIDMYIAERPFTVTEATLQISGNIFPKKELVEQLTKIRNSESIKGMKQAGYLKWGEEGKINWEPSDKNIDLIKYRLTKNDDPTGAIVIWEHPDDNPPFGVYIMGLDPYDHDKAGTNSLGSAFVYKRFQGFEKHYDTIVAEYSGRPETAEEYYENIRKLLVYYNATCLFENERKGIYPYFTNKHCDHLLADQPDFINEIIKDSKVKRRKGIHMTTQIKDWGEVKIRDWLNEEFEPGRKNLTRIYSEPLLEELIAYNEVGNFDRVIALMCALIYNEALHHVFVKKKKEENRTSLFDEPLFSTRMFENFGSKSSGSGGTLLEEMGVKTFAAGKLTEINI